MKRHTDKKLLKAFGTWLRNIRLQRNLTQEDLAWKTQMNIGRLERGEVNITLSSISRLAEALELEVYELLPLKRNSSQEGYTAVDELQTLYGQEVAELEDCLKAIEFKDIEIRYLKQQVRSLEEINRLLKEKIGK